MQKIELGIDDIARKEIAGNLSKFLADSYSLYLTTQNFHWNVTGPLFKSLHEMLEEHYTDLAQAVDEIAERIRALGFRAPGSFAEFDRLSTVKQPRENLAAMDMVAWLVEGQETVVRTARQALPAAQAANDESTLDLLVERMRVHEKRAWMLRAILETGNESTSTAETLETVAS